MCVCVCCALGGYVVMLYLYTIRQRAYALRFARSVALCAHTLRIACIDWVNYCVGSCAMRVLHSFACAYHGLCARLTMECDAAFLSESLANIE